MKAVLIAITTGRSTFRDTLNMLARNLAEFGHFDQHRIGCLINYDPNFMGIPKNKFNYSSPYNRYFNEIIYIGPQDVPIYRNMMRGFSLDTKQINVLCQVYGFGNKKNIILLNAILKGYDMVLFWDDDEYPVICMQNDTSVVWQNTDILTAHLREISNGADVATGFWTGHVFPTIPDIHKILHYNTATLLGEALGLGTETHSRNSFVDPTLWFHIGKLIPEINEIKAINGGKWVSGGNISVNVQSVLEGIVPPYYTPVDSRGDDTIFSMHLSRAKVMSVPSGAYHDMYLDYPKICRENFPKNPGFIEGNNEKYMSRFAFALRAWLAYAPLFIKLKGDGTYKSVAREMISLLRIVDSTLFQEIPKLKLIMNDQTLADLFEFYLNNVESQYQDLQLCYDAWQSLLLRLCTG